MRTPTGAAVLVQLLRRAGVERVFTLSGNQILPIFDAGLDAGIAFTDTRHEAAAAHMADAWARVRGEPGVCLFSAGPGHTNALSAILNAARAESPVLWLSGGTTRAGAGRGGFQDLDQVGLAERVCKGAWRVDDVSVLPQTFALAWRTMLSGRPGPVHLTLPADLLAQPAAVEIPADLDLAPAVAPADPATVDEALELLATALKPLVLAGPGLARGRGDAAMALEAFVDATGLPCLPVESPRGLTDPIYQGMGRLTKEADIVLLLASRDFAVGFAQTPAFAACRRVIVVDPAAVAGPTDLALAGDPVAVLRQLVEGAGRFNWNVDPWIAELSAARSAANAELVDVAESTEVPIHPLRLATEIHDLLPEEATTVFDGGEFAQWARWAFGDWIGQTLVNGKLGMIGPSIPFAIGTAIAQGGGAPPVVAFLGDGTAGYHIMEFDTAVRHNVPFVAVIGNDAGWGAELHRQLSNYGEDRVVASYLLPSRYDEVARALGAHGEFVQSPEEIAPAIRRALASGKPACVNVLIRSLPSPTEAP
ncbi:MAG: thiamine pyrophosphate-binding protein [Thermomicrobiales bacterium]